VPSTLGSWCAGGRDLILLAMAKYRGTIRRNDLEGGHWQLEAEDGTTYVLEDAPVAVTKDGTKVEIEGAVDRGAMGFAMTGPVLKVKSAKPA
jgi:hypothetical protein